MPSWFLLSLASRGLHFRVVPAPRGIGLEVSSDKLGPPPVSNEVLGLAGLQKRGLA
jgi:hypothetical protein